MGECGLSIPRIAPLQQSRREKQRCIHLVVRSNSMSFNAVIVECQKQNCQGQRSEIQNISIIASGFFLSLLAIPRKLCYISWMSKQDNTKETTKDPQKTKEHIIAATYKVFAEKGYEATTLREISREAQVAPGLVHYYFGGKDQLLVEVLQAAGQSFGQKTEQLVQNVPAEQSLDAFLTNIRERVKQDSNVYRLRYESFSLGLHNPLIEPKVRERLAQRREEIGSVITKVFENLERAEGKPSPAIDPASLGAVLLSIFDGLALQKIMDTDFDLDAAYQVLAQMLHGLQSSEE